MLLHEISAVLFGKELQCFVSLTVNSSRTTDKLLRRYTRQPSLLDSWTRGMNLLLRYCFLVPSISI